MLYLGLQVTKQALPRQRALCTQHLHNRPFGRHNLSLHDMRYCGFLKITLTIFALLTAIHYAPMPGNKALRHLNSPKPQYTCSNGLVGALEEGIRLGNEQLPSLASYESNVLYALRFMVDTEMGGGHWLEIPAGVHSTSVLDYYFVIFDLQSKAAPQPTVWMFCM